MSEIFPWIESVQPASRGGRWKPVERGGSDRRFWRGSGAAAGLVAVAYGPEKAENARYADCALFLRDQGVSVPRVMAHDAARRFLLLEDVGSEDLWSQRAAPRETRGALYREALRQVALLHRADLAAAARAGVLQAPFDAVLYRWEQDYFFEHFLGAERRDLAPFEEQAAALAERPRVLLHRDFQSQNILIRDGAVKFIDFQGMRAGLAGYDVASLLYDPYVDIPDAERAELARFYREAAGRHDAADWENELPACARQRLMQALGAYGFLGRVKGKTAFLRHIPAAAERLAALCEGDSAWQPLAGAVRAAASA
ncbi:MAG: aminoglycoside phosphotransferase family protein [Chthoniobacterales bacterium]|jgi:aminoglycoside/choline kinase family phosphotransferase